MKILQWAVLVFALAPFAYYVLATYCGWEYFRGVRKMRAPEPAYRPPVSILKPVRGLDRDAYENFASFCRIDYPAYEIIFAVPGMDDPAAAVIEKLQCDFPGSDIRLLYGSPRIGTNSKVNKLCNLVKSARHEVLAISDSDVRVEPDCLNEMVAPLADPKVGLVTSLFRGMPGEGLASELNALGVPADSASSSLVARKLEGNMHFAFGWMMSTTKQRLAEIGGFEAIANYHSDDFEIGNRMAAKGYRVELMRKHVWMVFPSETMEQFIGHEMRWSIGLRNVRKMGYLGLALTYGLPWAVLAAVVAPSAGIAAAYLAAYLILRLTMAWTVGVWGIGDPVTRRSLWLVPVRDAINFVVWVGGFFSDKIQWRGLTYRVKDGQLIPLAGGAGARRAGDILGLAMETKLSSQPIPPMLAAPNSQPGSL